LIHELLAATRDVVGRDTVALALSRVSASVRDDVEGALPGSWVPISSIEHVFGAIAAASGRDIVGLHNEVARISVERALKSVWRLLLRLTTDEALVSRTPVIFSKAYNRGRLIPAVTGLGRGEVQLVDWPDAPEWPVRGTRVGIETVLRVAGRKEVRAEVRRTATGAFYVVTWK
jgi:hypothetical protein